MKTDYIYNIPAGRELDALIAEHVMMYKDIHWNDQHTDCYYWENNIKMGADTIVPIYSRNMMYAWEVVEKMGPYKLEIVRRGIVGSSEIETNHKATFWHGMMGFPVVAETAPLAICRAALLTMTYKLE